jgi:hypothetical protein
MGDYVVIPVDERFDEFMPSSNYIILFNVDKTPPHLGFVYNGKYYTLTYDGCQIGTPLTAMTKYFNKGKSQCLIIETNQNFTEEKVTETFQKYHRLNDGRSTCLFPIKELFGFGDEIGFVYHLIPELQRLKKVKRVFGVNLRDNQEEVSIFKYSMEMIQDRIKELANAEGK